MRHPRSRLQQPGVRSAPSPPPPPRPRHLSPAGAPTPFTLTSRWAFFTFLPPLSKYTSGDKGVCLPDLSETASSGLGGRAEPDGGRGRDDGGDRGPLPLMDLTLLTLPPSRLGSPVTGGDGRGGKEGMLPKQRSWHGGYLPLPVSCVSI